MVTASDRLSMVAEACIEDHGVMYEVGNDRCVRVCVCVCVHACACVCVLVGSYTGCYHCRHVQLL